MFVFFTCMEGLDSKYVQRQGKTWKNHTRQGVEEEKQLHKKNKVQGKIPPHTNRGRSLEILKYLARHSEVPAPSSMELNS